MFNPSDPYPETALQHVSAQEAVHVLYQFGAKGGYESGSFVSHLLSTIGVADQSNRAKLSLGFPGYVTAMNFAQNDPKGIEKLQEIAPPPPIS